MKIITVLGARPQFIKAAMVSRTFSLRDGIEEIIVHTGQHFDTAMSAVFFEEMNIPEPHYHLGTHGMDHASMTGNMMIGLEEIYRREKPDFVLVYGDTNSTLAGALTAVKMQIKTVHVEAGLRSFNRQMPEEINRIITDRISDILFCPSKRAYENLMDEGFSAFPSHAYIVGDVMYDSVLYYAEKMRKPSFALPASFILCTVHRAENTDDPVKLTTIIDALENIAREEQPVVFPLHPRTLGKLRELDYDMEKSPVHFIPPVGYFEMLWLLDHSLLVMTDSGGLQKEAYFFDKYCVTLREETEWTELTDNGYNTIAGTASEAISDAVRLLLRKEKKPFRHRLYGQGKAAEEIADMLLHSYKNG